MTLNYPFAILSDIHFHSWNFGSYINTEGVNSRLQDTINEFKRACYMLRGKYGGNDVVITGDMFHTRGEIKPSVYNPVYAMFSDLTDLGFRFFAIPGNHDLESDDSRESMNSFASFSALKNFYIYYEVSFLDTNIGNHVAVFVPWTESPKQAIAELVHEYDETVYDETYTVFAHIGLSDVVTGVGNTTNPEEFSKIKGIKNVFCGHFHNHKHFTTSVGTTKYDVYSVGALLHQSFKDVGSLAGFIICESPDKAVHYESRAPKFVDFDYAFYEDIEKIRNEYSGNFVRAKRELTKDEAASARAILESVGALRFITPSVNDKVISIADKVGPVVAWGIKVIDSPVKQYIEERYSTMMASKIFTILNKDGIDYERDFGTTY